MRSLLGYVQALADPWMLSGTGISCSIHHMPYSPCRPVMRPQSGKDINGNILTTGSISLKLSFAHISLAFCFFEYWQ